MVGKRLEVLALGIKKYSRSLPEMAIREDKAGSLSRPRRPDDEDMGGFIGSDRRAAENTEYNPLLCREALFRCFQNVAEAGGSIGHLPPVDDGEKYGA